VYKQRHLTSNEYLLSPNHLETFESVDIAANRTQQFWLTISVPEDTRPGHYEAQARVEAANAPAKTIRLGLDILPVRTLAPRGALFGMYSYYLKNDTKAKLMAGFRDMRDHGMTTTFMFNPWLRIPLEAEGNGGKPRILWNEANQLRELFEAYKEAGFPEALFLIAPDAFFKAAEKYGGACGTPEFAAVYRDLWSQVLAEKARKGWPDFYVAPYDEGYPYPFTEERFKVTRVCSGVLRGLKIPVALHALNHPIPQAVRFEEEFYPSVDAILLTFCHPPVCVTGSYRGFADWNEYRSRVKADGKKLLFYNVDCTGVHPEAMRFSYGAGLWNRKADGIMDWHYQEPHQDGGYGISPIQGSTILNFTYPAAGEFRGGPSIGWEGVREGVKDYTLLYTLRALTDRAAKSSDAAVREMGKNAARNVDEFLSRITFSTIDPTSALSVPARFELESWGEDGARVLSGDFKIPNGLSRADYDRLRRMICDYILLLQDRVGM
jgi:hypothetical protein